MNSAARQSMGIVEHVRVVHMLLVVSCIGLILVTLSARSYNPAKALTQLEAVQHLQKMWSPEFLYNRTEADVNTLPSRPVGEIKQKDTSTWASVPPLPPHDFPCWSGNIEYNCKPGENWKSNLPESWTAAVFPRTVAEFTRFWDSVEHGDHWIDFVNQIAVGVTLTTPPQIIRVSGFGAPPGDRSHSRTPLHTTVDKPLWLVSRDSVKDQQGNAALQYWDRPEKANVGHEWEIPVLTRKRVKINQEALVTFYPESWKKGSFTSSFTDLARASVGLEELEFDDLREKLKAEAASGTGFFEVAGIKIPATQVTTVGIVAVLCVQFYLLILLRELSRRIQPGDPSWDIPWIGLFGSRLARWATWTSIVLCPLACVVVLAWRGFLQATPARFAFLVAPIVACILGSATWMYRPRTDA